MRWLVIPIEELKLFDKDWEYRRKSVDGTKAIIHENLYNELVPPAMNIPEKEEEFEITYPFPVLNEIEINKMLDTEEWKGEEL